MTSSTTINERDLDALRRAVLWARDFQLREPQIRVIPDVMPEELSSEWFELTERLVAVAQSHNLGLRPWQSPPIDVAASGFANQPEEIELVRRMIDLGISAYEPYPATAIASATHGATHKETKRVKARKIR
jgi:hypothetical protein